MKGYFSSIFYLKDYFQINRISLDYYGLQKSISSLKITSKLKASRLLVGSSALLVLAFTHLIVIDKNNGHDSINVIQFHAFFQANMI